MNSNDLLEIAARGEDSRHQFKVDCKSPDSLSADMVALSNSHGGRILIGVTDQGQIQGISQEDLRRLNQMISTTASQSVRPPINPETENISVSGALVLVATISSGISKPYMDNHGIIWVKSGADKRKVTSREEIQRMFQSAGLIHADEVPVSGAALSVFDHEYFRKFFEKIYDEPLDVREASLKQVLQNLNLSKEGVLNLAAVLLFAKNQEFLLPAFCVKCVSYPGNDIHVAEFRDSEDIAGKLENVFHRALGFLTRSLHHVQKQQNVNALGILEIPKIALEELLTNALIHRDYFVMAPIRIFIFDNRVEIISPGHLPNHLTIENIKNGNSNIRNPILTSFATKILPYRGLGNGIRRALKEYPDIEFQDDRQGNQFKVIIHRQPH